MAAPMRIVFCFAFPFLLLQLQVVNCRDLKGYALIRGNYPYQRAKNTQLPVQAGKSLQDEPKTSNLIGTAEAGKSPKDKLNESVLVGTPTLEEEIMRGLQLVDDTEQTITTNVATQLQELSDRLKSFPEIIESAKEVPSVKNAIGRALRDFQRNLRWERRSVAENVCYKVKMFRAFLKKVAPTNELADFTKQADFQSLLNGKDTEKRENEFKALTKGYEVNRMLKITTKPENEINEWKAFAITHMNKFADAYKSEMENIEKQATRALHMLYNAVVVYKDMQVELKDGQKRPTEMKEKEDMIMNALRLHRNINCPT